MFSAISFHGHVVFLVLEDSPRQSLNYPDSGIDFKKELMLVRNEQTLSSGNTVVPILLKNICRGQRQKTGCYGNNYVIGTFPLILCALYMFLIVLLCLTFDLHLLYTFESHSSFHTQIFPFCVFFFHSKYG